MGVMITSASGNDSRLRGGNDDTGYGGWERVGVGGRRGVRPVLPGIE